METLPIQNYTFTELKIWVVFSIYKKKKIFLEHFNPYIFDQEYLLENMITGFKSIIYH